MGNSTLDSTSITTSAAISVSFHMPIQESIFLLCCTFTLIAFFRFESCLQHWLSFSSFLQERFLSVHVFVYLVIYFFNQYLLSVSHVSGILSGTGEIVVNKIDKVPALT